MADPADIFNSLPLNASYQYDYLLRDVVNWYFLHQSTIWTTILLTPLVVTFMLPVFMLLLVYVSALYLKAYRYYHKINGYEFTFRSWEQPRHFLAYIWNLQAKFWYGYEVVGLDNIPLEGSALIVFYHGAMPVDWYYLLANVILRKKEYNMCAVGDRFLFSIPAFDDLIDCLQIYPGTVETCAELLKKGNLLSIAPGGVREALFGDETYPLIWGSRKGFAKVAMEAEVPIIPVFTENIREAFFTLSFGRNFLRKVYERSRIPLVPIYGGFPVKLRTYVGKPINYDPSITPEEMAIKVADKMKEMIAKHQTLPGTLTGSILQRFGSLFNFKSS